MIELLVIGTLATLLVLSAFWGAENREGFVEDSRRARRWFVG